MSATGYDEFGSQGLHLQSPSEGTDDCEQCHNLALGSWYTDDHDGGSEWFLCDRCVYRIRKYRDELEQRTEAAEIEAILNNPQAIRGTP